MKGQGIILSFLLFSDQQDRFRTTVMKMLDIMSVGESHYIRGHSI